MVSNTEVINKGKRLNYPTPFFLTSKKQLQQNYEWFKTHFEGPEVCYALKSNADPKIIKFLKSLESSFEAASFFEIELLMDNGVKPSNIVYGTSVKPVEHIQRAFKAGIKRFAADSGEEIEKIAKHAPGANVFVRAVVNDSDSVFAFSERFGAPPETIHELMKSAKKLGLVPYGLSFHVGSQATHVEHWSDAILALKPAIEKLHKDGIILEVLNIGGGFPVEYSNHKHVPELGEIAEKVHRALDSLPYRPRIIVEPGRALIAAPTIMVAEVISKTIRRGKTWLVLDGGIYNCLYEAMIHQGTTQYEVHTTRKAKEKSQQMPCVLAGPTGDSLDIISRDVTLPESMQVGDKLIFENAGAYTVTMASSFNGFPKPELYLI